LRDVAEGAGADLTALLDAWKDGDQDALDRLVALVYPELRRIARRQLEGRRPGDSLGSVGLANEAYLRLVRAGGIACENRVHFLALCAQIMRRIVVDHARERASAKRGGGVTRVPIEEALLAAPGLGVGLLELDDALEALSEVDPRKGRLVELRYFGGLTIDEAAEVLHVSPGTAKRDWLLAKAWLLAELSGDG
jgi:RNA polymerase sigma-70 factor (ECF subfamily)